MLYLVTTQRNKLQCIIALLTLLLLPEIRALDLWPNHLSSSVDVSPIKPGSVTYNLMLTCENHANWCAEFFVRELDRITAHDPWLYGIICSDKPTANVTGVTLFPGGDGYNKNEYEVSTLVYHNCTLRVHENNYECNYNTPKIRCRKKWMTDEETWASMNYTCACHAPLYKKASISPGDSVSEMVLLEDCWNTFDTANIDRCQYPEEFYDLKNDPNFEKWITPPCTWEKHNWFHGNKIVNFVENYRNSGPITLNITLSCMNHDNWCADIYLSEHDSRESEELFFGTVCTNNRTAKFSGMTLNLGSDGFFDSNYELYTKIYHNCTSRSVCSEYSCPWNIKEGIKCPYDQRFPQCNFKTCPCSTKEDLCNSKTCACNTQYAQYPVAKNRTINEIYELTSGTDTYTRENEETCAYPTEFIGAYKRWTQPLLWFHPPCNWTDTVHEQYGIIFVNSDQPQILLKDDLAALELP